MWKRITRAGGQMRPTPAVARADPSHLHDRRNARAVYHVHGRWAAPRRWRSRAAPDQHAFRRRPTGVPQKKKGGKSSQDVD